MADDTDKGFLSRWARRKQRAAREPEAKPAGRGTPGQPTPSEPEPSEPTPSEAERAEAEARRQELIDSLPEPEQLGPEDDYTRFLQDGVPDDLRQRALRRLWTSNPVFANLDGLNDYDLDYTDAATVVENLKTAFQAGRGMVTKEEREAEAAAAERAARGEPDPETDAPESDAPENDGSETAEAIDAPAGADADAAAEAADAETPAARARYRQTPDGRVRVKGSAAQRRWGG
ncbi:MAG: DUF3306 domain-containing protein [Rhodovibrio sp.]|nr:DUF3306 domain-containing protein [Rhodovibrio sp.]